MKRKRFCFRMVPSATPDNYTCGRNPKGNERKSRDRGGRKEGEREREQKKKKRLEES